MSVIAKVYVSGSEKRYGALVIEAAVVAESPLMAECGGKENENVVFSKASPSGQMRAKFPAEPGLVQGDQLYVIFTRAAQSGAPFSGKAKIYSITDFGGTSRQVQIQGDRIYDRKLEDYKAGELMDFSFSILIDNPGAYEQFKAGDESWFFGLYRAGQVTMQQALALAHRAAAEEQGA